MTQPLAPPPLMNNCFALPAGTDWTPVDVAHTMLQERLSVVVGTEQLPLQDALDRVLAQDVVAARANPPQPNSAVDGYGMRHADLCEGPQTLPLVEGRSAAGEPFDGDMPAGHAVRILTGATIPEGVDTVILQEDVSTDGRQIAFHGGLKKGANVRRAGEDVDVGNVLLRSGRRLSPADMALLTATGVSRCEVRKRLRVAVLSTGDELAQPGDTVRPDQIFDANRPMLLAMIKRFGFEPVDAGRAPDNRDELKAMLDAAAESADLILTSGGASAGEEDHLSALLNESGAMSLWRLAIKPGRPLALGFWKQKPVFGLPGNPVAAMVCALVFSRPAMGVLAGEGWKMPTPLMLPANFCKNKKPGRREYLRARLRDGKVDVFRSEGSGLISGLSWAEGLVELPDGACEIELGTPVAFYSYASFGM